MDLQKWFLNDWNVLSRTVIVGFFAYFALILFLRLSGKRTLSKMNAFDLVVTIALGSTLSSILINKDVTLAQGATAFAVLIGLQFLITWISYRARWFRSLITGEPTLLLYRGQYVQSALRRMRVTENEIQSAIRSAGLASVEEVEAVVLETDGSFSVVQTGNAGPGGVSSLKDIDVPAQYQEPATRI